jgi:hypothetical protein
VVEPPELVVLLVVPLLEPLVLESVLPLVPLEQAAIPAPAIVVSTIGPITEEMRISTPLTNGQTGNWPDLLQHLVSEYNTCGHSASHAHALLSAPSFRGCSAS